VNTVEFRVTGDPKQRHLRVIHPYVDGVPLAELARAVERRFAEAEGDPTLAGAYVGLGCHDGDWEPARQYLGRPAVTWYDDGDTVLLACSSCGEWDCWPLTARVTVDRRTVRWSDFRTGHRPWDLTGIGPFTFDRAQYEGALPPAREAPRRVAYRPEPVCA
jgi:hypothetical protein